VKRIIVVFFLYLFSCVAIYGQKEQGYLEIKGGVKVDRQSLEGAKIKVMLNGEIDKTYEADADGRFSFRLDLNKNYGLVISKQGYFSKILSFNTAITNDDVGIWNYKFAVELIPEIEGFDASILDEPIGKIKFVDRIGEFDYDEAYTTAQLKKIDAMMREYEKRRKQLYNKVVADADDAFNKGDYDTAVQLYDKAIDIDPYDTYPDDQIVMIDKILSKDRNAQKNYDKAIEQADNYFKTPDYNNAKTYYNKALKFKNENYPKDQLALIDKLLNDKDASSAALAEKERAYQAAVAAGDRGFNEKQFEAALAKFNEATGIKPAEQYPKDKIAEITAILDKLNSDKLSQAEKDKAYNAAITSADDAFSQKQYTNARADYVKASGIKPQETYPRSKITEIDNLLAANKSIEEKYKGFIEVADQSFNQQQYQSAKGNYQQALSIKPNEAYPTSKIKEIDALLLLLAQKNKKELEENYQKAILEADAALNKKDYSPARDSYQKASNLKPNEVYPKQKIAEIDQILADLGNKKRAYDLAIARADNQFNSENWEAAKTEYQGALVIFPAEQYPQTRLNEIENKLLALKSAKDQLAAREKAYSDAIAKGDGLYNEKKWVESKNAYSQALAVKPGEKYPTGRIAEIETLIAARKALDDKYAAIISTADGHFMNNRYEDAKTTYNNALLVKPNEAYPKQKIAEINVLLAKSKADKEKMDQLDAQYNQLIAEANGQYDAKAWQQAKTIYQQAVALKTDEVFPKQRITEIDNLLAKMADENNKYQDAVASADALFNSSMWSEALAFYNQASTIKPDEIYPKQRIGEINRKLGDLKKNDADYAKLIVLADAAYSNKELENARGQYQAALAIKSGESYPKQRIAEIDKLLDEQKKLSSEKNRIEAQYNLYITKADQLLSQKDYQQAKTNYQQASALKSEVMYPKEKISEIDNILETLSAQQKAYDAKMNEGANLFTQMNLPAALSAYQMASQIKPDEQLPKQKMAEIQALIDKNSMNQQNYQKLITQADNLFQQKKYQDAKPVYQQASGILPNEKYPVDQLAKINGLMNESSKLAAQQAATLKAYQAKIAEADNLFNDKKYSDAMSSYMDAKGIKPDETYPDQQLSAINKLLADEQQKVNLAYNSAMQSGDQLVIDRQYLQAKEQYTKASGLKPQKQLPKTKLKEIDSLIEKDRISRDKQAKIDADYSNLIGQADNTFKATDYSASLALYKNALNIKPAEKYPRDQMEICERKIQDQKALSSAEEEKRRKDELAKAQNSFDKKDFDYSGEKREKEFLNELSKQYPEGITVEKYDKPNKKIKRVIVNHKGIAKEYIQVTYSYGTFYFRNGQNISQSLFYSETKE